MTVAQPALDGDALLRAWDLRKVFGGAVALARANLSVRAGEIHALLGENGAGKSTLIKCLAGTPAPDSGTIIVAGRELPRGHSARHAAEAGLAFIHQESTLVESLSVEENIALTNGYGRRFGAIDWRHVRRAAKAALDIMGVDLDPSRLVAELPPATRTVVAIARALARSARIVILDEPTAALGASDVQALFRVLRRISAGGGAVVFVSHRLDEVHALCDRVSVLRDGHSIGTVVPSEISKADLVTLICGHPVAIEGASASRSDAPSALVASGLTGNIVGPISFSVCPGEIVGFTGLSDAGHYEIGEMLFGVKKMRAGRISLFDRPFAPASPAQAMRAGIGYVPPDRAGSGLAADMTLAENLFFNPRVGAPNLGPRGFVSPAREHAATAAILRRFEVRPPLPEARILSLSGGNAQKVLVARWLHDPAAVLIINDVSVGVDIGAREEIYRAIRAEAAQGASILLITSDFEEVEALCERAFVLVRGRLRAHLRGGEISVPNIASCLVGGATDTRRVAPGRIASD